MSRRAARAAYRRSLPLAYRVRRWVIGLVVVGLLGGGLAVLGRNPWSWLSDRWNDVRGTLVEVAGVQAAAEPSESEITEFPAGNATDQLANTAWVAAWAPSAGPLDESVNCLAPSATPTPTDQGTLLLFLPEAQEIKAMIFSAGLADLDPSRPHQWRPKTVQLTFTDGQCQQVTLADMAGPQQIDLTEVTSTAVRVRVLDAYPAAGADGRDLVAFCEVQILARP